MTLKWIAPSEVSNALEGRLSSAIEMAAMAGEVTLKYFRTRIGVQRKGDNSPVTIADQEAEKAIRSELERRYPKDSILGEEFGVQAGTSEYQWIIDPIDGTKSFISGVPLYSTLIGIVRDRECLGGVILIPALNEIVLAARGTGAWHASGDEVLTKCAVSQRKLADGLFAFTQVDSFAKRGAGEGYHQLEAAAYVTRSWGDGYGYMLVATGRAELMVDPIANPWDLAAVQPIIEEAGGRFTSWTGESTVFGGDGIGSNGLSHELALKILRG
ncbi:MAG: histidinol-phosphatase [Planctomycetales bacterium]|nr:histidinol-phosphatase [Planctomycetales bacterium]